VPAEARQYNSLFLSANPGADGEFAADLNPQSLEILTNCRLEPSLATGNSAEPVQFERLGYFCRDADSAPGRLVFNRTIGLRDTYAKAQGAPVKGAKGQGGD
jgi:glutaminyl-tRNA synthetase